MIKPFVIPYVDQGMQFWEKLKDLYGPYIKEVYFPILDEEIGTGRPKQPDKQLLEFLESQILPVSVLVNPIVLPKQVENIAIRLIEKLQHYLQAYHLVGISLANISLARKIRENVPGLQITASTLMEIYNEQQLIMIGDVIDVLVPSNRILRDIYALEQLKTAFEGKLRLLVNESCLSSCVCRTQHFFEMSNPAISFPCSLCNELLAENPWLALTGGWILPQHLYMFDGLYDEIKLAGRISLQQPDRYFHVMGNYVNRIPLQPHQIGGGPAAIQIPMDIDTEFYSYTLHCDKNCRNCSICSDYWVQNVIEHG